MRFQVVRVTEAESGFLCMPPGTLIRTMQVTNPGYFSDPYDPEEPVFPGEVVMHEYRVVLWGQGKRTGKRTGRVALRKGDMVRA